MNVAYDNEQETYGNASRKQRGKRTQTHVGARIFTITEMNHITV